jgi:hypothetical protein
VRLECTKKLSTADGVGFEPSRCRPASLKSSDDNRLATIA